MTSLPPAFGLAELRHLRKMAEDWKTGPIKKHEAPEPPPDPPKCADPECNQPAYGFGPDAELCIDHGIPY